MIERKRNIREKLLKSVDWNFQKFNTNDNLQKIKFPEIQLEKGWKGLMYILLSVEFIYQESKGNPTSLWSPFQQVFVNFS
jgi:hypothetical protein